MKTTLILLALTALLYACNGASKSPARAVPGIKPSDVYLSLEQRGFGVEKQFNAEGSAWTCTQVHPSVSYTAELFGGEATSFYMAKGQVMAEGSKTAHAGADFLSFLASIPYSGSDPKAAQEWLALNYDTDGATTRFGSVQFTVAAPSEFYRMLIMEQAD